MRYGIIATSAVALLVSGCFGTTIKNINEYSMKPMAKSSVLPSEEELEGRPARVVVFNVDDQATPLAKSSKAGTAISGALVSQISKANARMIDKGGFTDLEMAIKDNQSSSKSNDADYAVTGRVSSANFSVEYTPMKTWRDPKSGEVLVIEPHCTYSASIAGNVKIHSVKGDIEVEKTVPVSGRSKKSIDLDRRHTVQKNAKGELIVAVLKAIDPSLDIKSNTDESKYCNNFGKIEIDNLIRSAGIDAVQRDNVVFQNFFSPKGYVLEHRMRGKESIFKVSLGKNNGLKEDLKAEIFTIEKSTNEITKKVSVIQNRIGEGTVSDQIHKQHAWIVVGDEKTASQVKLGDVVEIKYEKGLFEKLQNLIR